MAKQDKRDTKPMHPIEASKISTGPFSAKKPTELIPWVLDFHVGDRLLQVQVREQMVVGRGTGVGAPDIDLTAYRAEQNGVSRRHAILLTRSKFLTVRDLNSTNGTMLNGLPLPPDQDVPLEHGDYLTFGSLETRLMYAVLPPHKRAKADSDYETLKPNFPGAGQHVLIVEDDEDVAIAYQMMLRSSGYRVSTASSVYEVAPLFEEELPDAVILDLHLQPTAEDMSGLEVLQLLRRRMKQQKVNIPVVVVTAAIDDRNRRLALEAGATLFLPKPIRVDELAIRVGMLIDQIHSARA